MVAPVPLLVCVWLGDVPPVPLFVDVLELLPVEPVLSVAPVLSVVEMLTGASGTVNAGLSDVLLEAELEEPPQPVNDRVGTANSAMKTKKPARRDALGGRIRRVICRRHPAIAVRTVVDIPLNKLLTAATAHAQVVGSPR